MHGQRDASKGAISGGAHSQGLTLPLDDLESERLLAGLPLDLAPSGEKDGFLHLGHFSKEGIGIWLV